MDPTTGTIPRHPAEHHERRPLAASHIFHRTVGHGYPVVVVHGGLGLDHSYLRSGLDPLGAHLRLEYIDLRGNGRSPRPESSGEWQALTAERWAEDIEHVRRAIGADRIIVLGHSFGGIVAQEYALRHHDRVAGLILCTTYPSFEHAEVATQLVASRGTPAQLEALTRLTTAPFDDDAEFARVARAVLPLYFHRPDPELIAREFGEVRYSGPAFARSFLDLLPAFNSVQRLPSLRCPTLVVSGGDDWIAPAVHTGEVLRSLIPGAEHVVLEESGHMPFLEEPERFRQAVMDWIERHVPEAR